MKSKTLWLIISATTLVSVIVGCASFPSANSDTWIEYEMPPSKINTTRNTIMEVKLSDGARCYIFYDEELYSDSKYYYSILLQDFGWRSDGDSWKGTYTRYPKRGCIYLNPKRQVAVYFFPDSNTIGAFKVMIEEITNSQ